MNHRDEILGIFEKNIEDGLIHGAAMLVGGPDGDRWTLSIGRAGPDGPPMTPDTVVDIASVTKVLVTTTALLILRDRGLIDFEQPFTRYLPDFTAPLAAPVTVSELALHISGFGHVPGEAHRIYFPPDADGARILENVRRFAPLRPPRARYEYACWNFLLLGQIVEHVAKERLDDFAAREIFAPLAMRDSALGRPLADDPARLTHTIDAVAPGTISDRPARLAFAAGLCAGNAGAFTTARDLGRFARCVLRGGVMDDGRRLFSPGAFSEMTTNGVPPEAAAAGGDPSMRRGFGWIIQSALKPAEASPDTLYHGGWTGQTLFVDLGLKRYVVALTVRCGDRERANRDRYLAIGHALAEE